MSFHAPGTRYSNAETADIASDRTNKFGDTIFVQEGSGRETVVIGGSLYSTSVAGKVHENRAKDVALQLRDALRTLLEASASREMCHTVASLRALTDAHRTAFELLADLAT